MLRDLPINFMLYDQRPVLTGQSATLIFYQRPFLPLWHWMPLPELISHAPKGEDRSRVPMYLRPSLSHAKVFDGDSINVILIEHHEHKTITADLPSYTPCILYRRC